MKHGTGRSVDLNSGIQYEGLWEEDMKNGSGKLINQAKNQIIYGVWY